MKKFSQICAFAQKLFKSEDYKEYDLEVEGSWLLGLRYYLTVYSNDKKFRFLLDSGCVNSVIPYRFLKHFTHVYFKKSIGIWTYRPRANLFSYIWLGARILRTKHLCGLCGRTFSQGMPHIRWQMFRSFGSHILKLLWGGFEECQNQSISEPRKGNWVSAWSFSWCFYRAISE